MIFRLFRGVLRLRITAPLAVFDEPIPMSDGWKHLKEFLIKQEEREKEAIQEFLSRVKRDSELYGILRFYGVSELQLREILRLLQQSAVPGRDGIAVPFVLEMCAHVLSTSSRSEVSDITHVLIWRAYRSPGFIDAEQRERFVTIFGALAVR